MILIILIWSAGNIFYNQSYSFLTCWHTWLLKFIIQVHLLIWIGLLYSRVVSSRLAMKHLLLFFALFVVAKGCLPTYKPGPQKCACGVPLNRRRIVGGRPALVDEYPWMVALTHPETGSQFCAGSLLSSTTVLTAAHCIASRHKTIAVALPNGDVTFENATQILTSKII